ncbi:hypothetical protein SAMN06265795_11689 [Noviherbaspirillum humi]|uniref:Uncharacterized protein n=1 Tax=Noviherbaspirillum humi TaxID=1688639 RepID=A0A239KL94_9BURK|nr:hypothetical protein [Noviherbaspirillum humi]SNT19157.1 hypothetical protein SAMN06265795_11689 [Noviherbaspirillum humi]
MIITTKAIIATGLVGAAAATGYGWEHAQYNGAVPDGMLQAVLSANLPPSAEFAKAPPPEAGFVYSVPEPRPVLREVPPLVYPTPGAPAEPAEYEKYLVNGQIATF